MSRGGDSGGGAGHHLDKVAAVVVSAVVIYLALIVNVRVLGQRSLAATSSFDFGVAVALGAVIGRTVLLLEPTLLTGLVAMTVLFATQGSLGVLRSNRRVDRLLNRPPVLLMAGRTPLPTNMRRSHVSEDELRQRIRLAGVSSPDDVLAVVLERNGQVSVLRRGPLSLELFEDVAGGDALRDLVEHGRPAPTAPDSPWPGDAPTGPSR